MPHLFEFYQQRIFIGEPSDFLFGMDELPIDFDIKDAAAAGDEGQVLDALTKVVQQSGRQTGGLRQVISHHAEGDLHVHARLPGCVYSSCCIIIIGCPNNACRIDFLLSVIFL